MQVARYGLGRTLCHAVDTMGGAALHRFLACWRVQLKTCLRDDPEGFLEGRRCKNLAASVPNTFPNLRVLQSYLHPLVSNFANSPLLAPVVPRLPDVVAIAEHFELEHVYETTNRILKMVRQSLWRGLVYREVWLQAFACVNNLEHPVSSLRFPSAHVDLTHVPCWDQLPRGMFHYLYDTLEYESDGVLSIVVAVDTLDKDIERALIHMWHGGEFLGVEAIDRGLIKSHRVKLPTELVIEAQNSAHTWGAYWERALSQRAVLV